MFAGGKLAPEFIAQAAGEIAARAGLDRPRRSRSQIPDRRRARCRVLTIRSRARSCRPCWRCIAPTILPRPLRLPSGCCATRGPATRSAFIRGSRNVRSQLGLELPVCRVIVNQAHCFATGGSFDNALPFSLSMGCGTWGRNSISDNLNYRHFLNITRVVHPLPPERVREPTDAELFGDYRAKHGAVAVDGDAARGHRPACRNATGCAVPAGARARDDAHLRRVAHDGARAGRRACRAGNSARRGRVVHAAQRGRGSVRFPWRDVRRATSSRR